MINDLLKPETLQARKSNMANYFALNKLTKKKTAMQNRVTFYQTKIQLIQKEINDILEKQGIIEKPQKALPLAKNTREQQIINLLKEKGRLTVSEMAKLLNTNSQNIYQCVYRKERKTFCRQNHKWELIS